jgi:hypothetical protein
MSVAASITSVVAFVAITTTSAAASVVAHIIVAHIAVAVEAIAAKSIAASAVTCVVAVMIITATSVAAIVVAHVVAVVAITATSTAVGERGAVDFAMLIITVVSCDGTGPRIGCGTRRRVNPILNPSAYGEVSI